VKIPPSDSLIKAALAEDAPSGDLTSLATVAATQQARARLVARRAGVAAGLPLFARAFALADQRCRVRLVGRDGRPFKAGARLAEIQGPARALLLAERVALNFLQRLSGVATLTAACVSAAQGSRAKILDTRKTTPLLRALEKYAVRCGGGHNHRMGLSDAVLIKDNHIRLCGGSPGEAVRRARKAAGGKPIEVEVETLAELGDALAAHPDIVLLDNMPRPALKKALQLIAKAKPRVLSEISGGVTLRDIRGLARLGVDRISVGALTHSAPALDLSLEFF
jgi:nicotinate-nucleotide pyrophosphorylase (carboxylating)